MSFWAKLPCPTHILITGNVKFYQKNTMYRQLFTSSVRSYIILSFSKEYFVVHALVLQKSGHFVSVPCTATRYGTDFESYINWYLKKNFHYLMSEL